MEQRLILDRYRPLSELGEGGFGSVVLAYDTRMARRVAIKRLPLPLDARGRAVQAAPGLAEARTAALLNHPNIVTVHEWDTDDDEAFLIMEYVEGVPLGDILDSLGGRIEREEVAAVVRAVGSALAHAHREGVLHLDVKPDNVLVTRDGRIKVADFGLATLTRASGRAEGAGGTLGYMPLEQLTGEQLDARADQWALASLTYEALTGINPFDAETREAAVFKQEYTDVPLPSESDPDLPPAVDDVLMQALSPHPEDRFQGTDDLAAALLPWLGDAEEGEQLLAEQVRDLLGEEPAEVAPGLGLWDRLAFRAQWFRRGGAAAAGLWLGWIGLSALPLPFPAVAGAAALVALAGALAPALGMALAALSLTAGSFAHGLVPGLVALPLATAFWFGIARRGGGDGVAAMLAPLLGSLRAGPALPLVIGYAFDPLPAAIAAGAGTLWMLTFAAAAGGSPPLLAPPIEGLAQPWLTAGLSGFRMLFTDPGPWIVVLSSAAAAGLCSFWCRGGTRPWAIAGVVTGGAVSLGGYVLWSLTGNALSLSDPALLQQLTGSLILVVVVLAAGPPTRGEE